MMFNMLAAALLPALALGAANCSAKTQSQPNPIAAKYPEDTTGTINGTIAILPMDFSVARSMIPKEYAILRNAIKEVLPNFPAGMYPALVQAEFDHDIMSNGSSVIADFSRAGVVFPFVDRLGDGYTNMAYVGNITLSASSTLGIEGAQLYGESVTPGTFNPPCQAYAPVAGSANGATYFRVKDSNGKLFFTSRFAPTGEASHYSLFAYKNITNQPQFSANTMYCDNFIRLFNSSVTTGKYKPVPVQGTVSIGMPLLNTATTFKDVYGLRLDNAFIENNYLNCSTLQGYTSSGSGD